MPSLSLADEAIELFADRARRARPDFTVTDDNAATVTEICRRLDGMPLAIELAAARVRALSLDEIVDSLHDRFRLLTGGARTAVRRQQTLRASVDWSHALLTEPERILFRRLAVFLGGFDLDAAQAVAGDAEVERYQVLDQLTLLVDKSLVVAENTSGRTRYRLLETVRQYALEKLGESGEADAVRTRHRDHYTAMAALLDAPAGAGHDKRVEQADDEIDNLRGAFGWSLETADIEAALELASSLQPLWLARGPHPGRAGVVRRRPHRRNAHPERVAPAVRARALADKAVLDAWIAAYQHGGRRASPGDRTRTRRPGAAGPGAHRLRHRRRLRRRGGAALLRRGDRPGPRNRRPVEAEPDSRSAGSCGVRGRVIPLRFARPAEEGRDLADAIGDRFGSRQCRWRLAGAQMMQGNLTAAIAELRELVDRGRGRSRRDAASRTALLMLSVGTGLPGRRS